MGNLKVPLKKDTDCFFLSIWWIHRHKKWHSCAFFIRCHVVWGHDGKGETRTILLQKGETRGGGIFWALRSLVDKINLPVWKLVSIISYGAPATVGRASCKRHISFPSFIQYQRIIHQRALCSKVLSTKDEMDVAVKTVNSEEAILRPGGRYWGGARGVAAAYWCQIAKQQQVSSQVF